MKLSDVAKAIRARVLSQGTQFDPEINRFIASDRISELLNGASDSTLLVTNLSGIPLMRIANLMDAPGICFVNGVIPELAMIEKAVMHNIVLIVSPVDMTETCARLERCLGANVEAGS